MKKKKIDPRFFPLLNPIALKKQVKLIINKSPHPDLIIRVALYQGSPSTMIEPDQTQSYVLVFETSLPMVIQKEDPLSQAASELRSCLEPGNPRFLLGDGFREVYWDESKSSHNLGEWVIWERAIDEELPVDYVLEEYRWLLFERVQEDTTPKVRRRRYHVPYERVREAAERVFKDNPGISTAAVIRSKEIEKILKASHTPLSEARQEKTLREWIKDLNPNYQRRSRPPKGS